MSSENLRFSVEESVWFQKGQEVSELVSISLDPDIVIQEHDQYVSIRGALQLTGEYRIDENASEEEERDFTSVRLVNEVKTRDDGITELNHRFPVDITIPQNRVQSLDEVYVSIEAFDYDIPKRGCLKIIADLSISGIQNVAQTPPPVEPVEEPAREEFPVAAQEDEVPEKELELVRSSSFEEEHEEEQTLEEVRAEQEPVSEEVEEEEVVLQSPDEVVLHNPEAVDTAKEVEEVIEASDAQDDDLFVPFEVEARREAYQEPEELLQVVEEQVEEVVEEKEEEVATTLTPQIEVKARHDNKLAFGSDNPKKETVTAVEERSENGEKVEASNQSSSTRSENELLLTKIFGRDEVEEHTTMKICIVQSGDTLDKIAERYEISTQQLVRVNTLNEDSLSEGQLLYIPVQVNI